MDVFRARDGAMLLPIFLILLATLTAAAAVYGTLPQWILSQHGLEIIEWTRRLEWPLLTISLLLCFVLGVLVVIGKKRAWWLIGYAPIIALLLQHFVTGGTSRLRVIEQPIMVSAKDARDMSADEYVVGLVFNDQPCAFPYRQIYNAPVVLAQSRE